MNQKKRIYVVAVAFCRQVDATEVLLFRRKAGASFAGFYEFPGGKIEPGETEEQALEREIFEELGVNLKLYQHLDTRVWDAGSKEISLSVFKTQWDPQLIFQLNEHDDMQWVSERNQDELQIAPADLPFLSLIWAAKK